MKTVLINHYDHLHFFVENMLEALKKTFKTKVNQMALSSTTVPEKKRKTN